MKQVEVTILGQGYLLACPEDGQEALLEAVALVDREMSAIRDAGKIKARERMAVLAALNLAYRLAEHQRAALAAPPGAHDRPHDSGSSADSRGPSNDIGRGEPGAPTAVDLDNLIRRLDDALAEDGRLL